uniref:Uncharacterized protein n=1 Tax=Glossina pallidipes TaxID=7398 RepID=A0A1A9Z5X7_GLOPL
MYKQSKIMKNRPVTSNIVSEWEDSVVFDSDDPDFCNVLAGAVVNGNPVNGTSTGTIRMPPPPLLDALSNSNVPSLFSVSGLSVGFRSAPVGYPVLLYVRSRFNVAQIVRDVRQDNAVVSYNDQGKDQDRNCILCTQENESDK